MGFRENYRGGSASEQAARAKKEKKAEEQAAANKKMMKKDAAGWGSVQEQKNRKEQGGEKTAETKKPLREQSKEFTEEELVADAVANQLMEGYKRDPDMRAALDEDPKKAEKLRLTIKEKALSGASNKALDEFATELIEQMYGEPEVVVGTLIEDEGKKAA